MRVHVIDKGTNPIKEKRFTAFPCFIELQQNKNIFIFLSFSAVLSLKMMKKIKMIYLFVLLAATLLTLSKAEEKEEDKTVENQGDGEENPASQENLVKYIIFML